MRISMNSERHLMPTLLCKITAQEEAGLKLECIFECILILFYSIKFACENSNLRTHVNVYHTKADGFTRPRAKLNGQGPHGTGTTTEQLTWDSEIQRHVF